MSCPHDNTTPNTDDPTRGTCQDCGFSPVVLCDPEYDACSVMESLKDYPNDAARRRFLAFLRRNLNLSTGKLLHAQEPRRGPQKGGKRAGRGCKG
jgi:hypothetical protein